MIVGNSSYVWYDVYVEIQTKIVELIGTTPMGFFYYKRK